MEQIETIHDDSKENHEDSIKIEKNVTELKGQQQVSAADHAAAAKIKKFKLDYKELQNRQNFDLSDPNDMEIVKTILMKQNTARTKADLDILYKAFTDVKFIKDMEKDVNQQLIRKMLKNIQFAPYRRREVIFNQGEVGQSFYIIIQGSVWVLVPNKFSSGVTEEQLKISKELLQNPDMFARMTDEKFLSNVFPSFNLIATLKSGYSFGEIALRQCKYDLTIRKIIEEQSKFLLSLQREQTVRTATVVCTEDTVCAVVSREIFNSCISEFYKMQRDKEIKFLHQFHLFADLYKQDVEMILMSCIKHHFNKNYVIYSENQPSDRIYFLQEGEVEISKISDIFTENANDLYVSRTKDLNMTQLPFRNLGNQLSYKKTVKKMPVAKVCPDSIFGDEEALNNKKRVTKAVIISNDATYYSLKTKDFYQIMYKKYPPEVIEQLKKEILVDKIKHRQEKLCKNIIINQMFNSFEQKMREETYYSTNKLLDTTEIIRQKKKNKDEEKFNSISNTAQVSYSNSPQNKRNLVESPTLFVTDPKQSIEKIRSFTPKIQNNDSSQHLLSSSYVFKNNNEKENHKFLKSKFQNLTINQVSEDNQQGNQQNIQLNEADIQHNNSQNQSSNQATSMHKIFQKIMDTSKKEKYPDAVHQMSFVSSPLSGRRLQSAQGKRNKSTQRSTTQQQSAINNTGDFTSLHQQVVDQSIQQNGQTRPSSNALSPKQRIEDKIRKSNSLSKQQKKLILLSMNKQRRLNTPENNFYSFLENHNSQIQKQSIQSQGGSPQRSISRNKNNASPNLDSFRKQISVQQNAYEKQDSIVMNNSLRFQNQSSQLNKDSFFSRKDQNSSVSKQERPITQTKKQVASARAYSSNTTRETNTAFYSQQVSQTQLNFHKKPQNNYIQSSPLKKEPNSTRQRHTEKVSYSLNQSDSFKQRATKSSMDRSQSKNRSKKQTVLIMQPKGENFQRISCFDQEYEKQMKEMESDILNDQYVCDQVEAKLLMSLAVQNIIQKDGKTAPIDTKHPLIDIDYVRKYDREAKLYTRKSMMQTVQAKPTVKTASCTPKNNNINLKQRDSFVAPTEEKIASKFPINYMNLILDQQREKLTSAATSGLSTPKGNTFSSNPLRVSLARSRRLSVNPGKFYLKGDRKQQFYDDIKEDFIEKELYDQNTNTQLKTQDTNVSDDYAGVKPKYNNKSKLKFNLSIVGNEQKLEEFKRQVRSKLGKK